MGIGAVALWSLLSSLYLNLAFAAGPKCEDFLERRSELTISSQTEALRVLDETLPLIFQKSELEHEEWYQLLENFALPASESKSSLLVTALIGGGNVGKSTLFNAMPSLTSGEITLYLNRPASRTGWFAGMTRRTMIAAPKEYPEVVQELESRLGPIGGWQSAQEAAEPGPARLIERPELPGNMVFLDSPDFDTGAVDADTPENLEAALKVVRPADVLMIVLTPQTYRNQANIQRLAKLFRTYGKKKTILVFWGDNVLPQTEVANYLTAVANGIYGTNERGFPEPVLGAYFMPYSSSVAAGAAHPQLRAVGRSPQFADLIRTMNAQSREIREYSLRSAVRTIANEVEARLRKWTKQRMSGELYAEAILALNEAVAENSLENFPYERARDQLRERFLSLSSKLYGIFHQFAKTLAVPERQLTAFVNQIRGRSVSPSLLRAVENDHRWHDRMAISQFMMALRSGKVPLNTETPAGRRLSLRADAYARVFGEEMKTEEGKLAVKLPAPDDLSPLAREAQQILLDRDMDQLTRGLGERLNKAQLSTATGAELESALRRAFTLRSRPRVIGANILQFMTVTAPFVMGFELTHLGFESPLLFAVLGNLAARPFYYWSSQQIDAYLRNHLNRWFHGLQRDVTVHYLNEFVTLPTIEAMTETNPEHEEAVSQLESALRRLDPGFKPLPRSLDDVNK